MSLKSAVYGFAVGDALGVPYEFGKRGTFKCEDMTGGGTWCQPVGTWSDDTSMILATCDSIREKGGKVDVKDIANKFLDWKYKGAYSCNGDVFDIGGTTSVALSAYKKHKDTETCGLTGTDNNGNGGLMRILPLAFTRGGFGSPISEIKKVCAITHNTQISKIACGIYVDVLIEIEDEGRIDPETLEYRCYDYVPRMKESEIKSTGFVKDTLEAALWCYLTTDNYKDCVLKAVNLGGDTDTIAALAGGLAGAAYGLESIPKEWIDKLRNKELIEKCLF